VNLSHLARQGNVDKGEDSMKKRGIAATATIAAVSMLVVAPSNASTGCSNSAKDLRTCIVAAGNAAGDYATTVVSATVEHPISLAVVLYTSRPQQVDVTWSMVCSRGFSAGSRSGQFTLLTTKVPATPTHHAGPWSLREIKPIPMANSDSCTVSADAQLSGGGSLRLELLGIHR
jgi:hypothetical protein